MAGAGGSRSEAHDWDATAIAARLADGSTSSQTIVEALLERIAAIDAPGSAVELRSIIATAPDAMARAAAADEARARGEVRSSLHGVPVVVKDSIQAIGLPGTAGALSLAGRAVRDDAPLVARLRAAGMIVLAATNLSEWANLRSSRSTSGWSAVGGLTANPHRLDRSAGGSSSGSGAALAARLSPLAVGTETDGSITCPASLNGVVGLKPTVGRVPTSGVVPISASQDSPGPMARCVADVAALYEVLSAEPGVQARVGRGAAGLRVGIATTMLTGHPGTDACFEAAIAHLEAAGTAVIDVAYPATPAEVQADELVVMCCEMADDLSAYLAGRGGEGPRSLAEVIDFEDAHGDVELAHFGHELLVRALELGGRSSAEYAPARARNLEWATSQCLDPALAGVDLVVAPAWAPAWKSDLTLGDWDAPGSGITTAPAIAGWPIATLPMGLVDELPVGLSLVGRPGSEAELLAAAAGFERAAGLVSSGALTAGFAAPGRS